MADTKLKAVALGDGLYRFGGDIICTYPLLGTTSGTNSLTYHYQPYDVTVSWTLAEDGSKQSPTWKRVYKSSGGTS